MMSKAQRLLAGLISALSLALICGGCNAGRVFIASSSDYADYRSVRLAEGVDSKMAAAWHYIKEHPEGRYAERLKRYFKRVEPVFYKVRSRSIRGLEAYLRALPDGPHADEVLEELVERRVERRREQLATRKARATGARLDAERKRRRAASTLLLWWLTALLDEDLWDAPLSEAPGELLVRYQLSLPQPECIPHLTDLDHQQCVKPIIRRFRVAGGGGLVDRALELDLEVELDGGWRLTQATISGDAIFVHTEEARSQRVLDDSEQVAAQAAASFVAKLTAALFEQDIVCNGGTDARGVTMLVCEGLRLTIEPGLGGKDDVAWVERVDAEPSTRRAGDDGDEGY